MVSTYVFDQMKLTKQYLYALLNYITEHVNGSCTVGRWYVIMFVLKWINNIASDTFFNLYNNEINDQFICSSVSYSSSYRFIFLCEVMRLRRSLLKHVMWNMSLPWQLADTDAIDWCSSMWKEVYSPTICLLSQNGTGLRNQPIYWHYHL